MRCDFYAVLIGADFFALRFLAFFDLGQDINTGNESDCA